MRAWHLLAAVLAIAAVALSMWQLNAASRGLEIRSVEIEGTPATLYVQEGVTQAPLVVIAHGFAGSRRLMEPFAVTLARNGYLALAFDFPGHGHHRKRLTGDLQDESGATQTLLSSLDKVVQYGLALPQANGQLGLLGHSMASDVVVRYAIVHPEVGATVAVSLFSPAASDKEPGNLLIVVGGWEDFLRREALLLLPENASPGVTYGDFSESSARRLVVAEGSEHITVLYHSEGQAEALAWFDEAFGHSGSGFVDQRLLWIMILLSGLVVLAWPLSRLLPAASAPPRGSGLGWKGLLAIALPAALLSPLLITVLPSDLLPILVGDTLAFFFFVYGLITLIGLAVAGRLRGAASALSWRAIALAALCVTLYAVFVFGLALDQWVTTLMPIPERWPLAVLLLAGTAPYFLANGWLTRGEGAPRLAPPVTRLLFILSLAGAVALNLESLFFLILLSPALLLFFLVFGLFSSWTYAKVRHPLPGSLASAIAFALAMAAIFPLVGD